MSFARWHEEHAHEPVTNYARRDVPMLLGGTTLGVALEDIRRMGVGERIVYFYVVDEAGRLTDS